MDTNAYTITDAMHERHRERLAGIEADILPDLSRIAWMDAAARDAEAALSATVLAWLREQNVTG